MARVSALPAAVPPRLAPFAVLAYHRAVPLTPMAAFWRATRASGLPMIRILAGGLS